MPEFTPIEVDAPIVDSTFTPIEVGDPPGPTDTPPTPTDTPPTPTKPAKPTPPKES